MMIKLQHLVQFDRPARRHRPLAQIHLSVIAQTLKICTIRKSINLILHFARAHAPCHPLCYAMAHLRVLGGAVIYLNKMTARLQQTLYSMKRIFIYL